MYENILFEVDDAVATITLNRPEKLNAYIPEMGDDVVDAFRKARGDDAVRVILLTGAGRGFCAGVDLEALKASYAASSSTSSSSTSTSSSGPARKLGEEDFLRKLPLEIMECPKPVIAVINGAAVGVGVTMALPCDIRLAAQDAKIGLTFAKLGILPGLGSTHLLPSLVGLARAQELVLTARMIRAPEAEEIGLINRAIPADRLMQEAREMAAAMVESDPLVLASAKQALREGAMSTMREAMENEQRLSAKLRKARNAGG